MLGPFFGIAYLIIGNPLLAYIDIHWVPILKKMASLMVS